MHHEMMHALGFPGHVPLNQTPSVLTSASLPPYRTAYSDFDRKAIGLLYNPAIKAGISESQPDSVIATLQ